MTDYGRPVEFAAFLMPDVGKYQETLDATLIADRTGIDLVGIQDHPYQPIHLDAFSLIADLAARTDRVRFFPAVANLPLRPPAVMAKNAASLDHLSGGRFELGIGAGAFGDAIAAMDGPQHASPGEARRALVEAWQVIRLMWSGQRGVTFSGEFYNLDGATGLAPAHDMEIIAGVTGPKACAAAGEHADGWFVSPQYVPPQDLAGRHAMVDEGLAKSGREPSAFRRMYSVPGRIGGASQGMFDGPVAQWVEVLTQLTVEFGMDSYAFWPVDGDVPEQVRIYGEEVAPAVREAVAGARAA